MRLAAVVVQRRNGVVVGRSMVDGRGLTALGDVVI